MVNSGGLILPTFMLESSFSRKPEVADDFVAETKQRRGTVTTRTTEFLSILILINNYLSVKFISLSAMEFAGKALVPLSMFGLGLATGFVMRDELNMPTYMRIKMALVEHSILTRRKLNPDVLQVIDSNQGRLMMQRRTE